MTDFPIDPSTRRSGPYTATASQTVFDYGFPVLDADDLGVYRLPNGGTTETRLTRGTNYTVTGVGLEDGGTIVLTAAAAAGDRITIVGERTARRLTDFNEAGAFTAAALNLELDALAILQQEYTARVNRVLRLAQGDPDIDMTLPVAAARLNKVIGFGPSGNLALTSLATSLTNPLPIAEGGTGATTAAAARTALGVEPSGFRNALVNGDFAIDQYGLGAYAITGSNLYFVDRWSVVATGTPSGTLTAQRVSSGLTDSPFACRLARTAGTYAGSFLLVQPLESADSRRFAGRTVTVSLRARKGSASANGLRLNLNWGTGTDQTAAQLVSGSWTGQSFANVDIADASLSTSWQTFSGQFSVPSNATQIGLAVRHLANFAGSGSSNDWIEVTDVQIEPGAVATPFARRPAPVELALAQRFYAALNHSSGAWGVSATDIIYPVRFPTQMRAAPTMTLRTSAPTFNDFNIGVTGSSSTLTATQNVTEQGAMLRVNGFTGLTVSRPGSYNSSTALAAASAEL